MILIHPPIVKPSEPPPGVAKLMGACVAHGVPCRLLDANMEGILALLKQECRPRDTWGKRAAGNVERNLHALRDLRAYRSFDRYRRAVMDVNKVLEIAGAAAGAHMGLGNYLHEGFSPVKSSDLMRAAEGPESNPFYPYFSERLPALIEEEQTGLVGFSLNYLSQALCVFAMTGFLKKRFPGLRVVLGGGLITSWTRRPGWNNPFTGLIDHIITGPGEMPLLELMGVQGTAKAHFPPRYETLPMGDYISPGVVLPYAASTGCYWNRCAFCPEKAEGNRYAKVPDNTAMEDLGTLVNAVKPAMIHLVDNAISPSLMKALAKNPPGAPWYGFTRITEALSDLDFCMALRRSGCVMLKVGLESGDQGVLDAMHKGNDTGMTGKVLHALKSAGIGTYAYLLFGTPSESEAEARKTLAFTAAHAGLIDFLNVAVFNLPAHSPEAGLLDTAEFYAGDLSLYRDFVHPRGWGRKQVRAFLEKEFRREPSIAAIIRRDPPVFTSNHAPFFLPPPPHLF